MIEQLGGRRKETREVRVEYSGDGLLKPTPDQKFFVKEHGTADLREHIFHQVDSTLYG